MKFDELTKLIRNVKEIYNHDKIMLFGSQTIYTKNKYIDESFVLNSCEADFTLYSYKNKKELEDFAYLIDGTIGELSNYHNTFNLYAEGVPNFNEYFPKNYKNRLVNFYYNDQDYIQSMNIKDTIIMKLLRFDDKDKDYINYCIDNNYVSYNDIEKIIVNEYNNNWILTKEQLIERFSILFNNIELNSDLNF